MYQLIGDATLNETIAAICDRVYTNGLRFDGALPLRSTDAWGKFELGGYGGWTDSFYTGMIYLAYSCTRDEKFLRLADRYQDYYRKRAENDPDWCAKNQVLPLDHDTGFIFLLSQVLRYELTGEAEAKTLALKAADTLAARFKPNGNYILASDTWPWDTDPIFIEEKKGRIIIDSMMNIALLFWASKVSGDSRYAQIATKHANTVRTYMLRPDGSTIQAFKFDPVTGAPKSGEAGQGYGDDSCWARGQAWALYGFTQTYEFTGDAAYFETALQAAHYFVGHLQPHGLPVWDFACANQIFHPIDSSAAAIALSGLLSLRRFTKDPAVEQGAQRLLNGLLQHCSALSISGWESILLHGCIGPAYQQGAESNICIPFLDCPLVYGDYYFFEALLKLRDAPTA